MGVLTDFSGLNWVLTDSWVRAGSFSFQFIKLFHQFMLLMDWYSEFCSKSWIELLQIQNVTKSSFISDSCWIVGIYNHYVRFTCTASLTSLREKYIWENVGKQHYRECNLCIFVQLLHVSLKKISLNWDYFFWSHWFGTFVYNRFLLFCIFGTLNCRHKPKILLDVNATEIKSCYRNKITDYLMSVLQNLLYRYIHCLEHSLIKA